MSMICNGESTGSPPVFAYGWAFDRKFGWDYAVHNKLTRPLRANDYPAKKFGIKELNYGMITKEMEDDKVMISTDVNQYIIQMQQ